MSSQLLESNKKIRVLHIITGLGTGGAERMLTKLLSSMDQSRFELVVFSLSGRGSMASKIEEAGVEVYHFNFSKKKLNILALFRLIKFARAFNPDMIQGWMYHANALALIIKLLMRKKTKIFWNIRYTPGQLSDEKWLTAKIIRLSARFSSRPQAVIYNARRSVARHKQLGYAQNNVAVIANGFDIEQFKPLEDSRSRVCAQLNLSKQSLLIGHVARYHPMKDHQTFIKAASLLKKRLPEVCFILLGGKVDNANQELQTMIVEHALQDCIYLMGERQNLPHWFSSFDVAVLSSAWGEGFPNVLGEAMACGTPCVATDVGDSALIVNKTGRIVGPSHPEALSDAIYHLLTLPKKQQQDLSDAARKNIVNHYSLKAITAQYEKLYVGDL